MAFQVKARVLLELGAELISSDAIALYELIKNSIDAGAKKTEVSVVVTLKHSNYQRLKALLETGQKPINRDKFVAEVESALEQSASQKRKVEFLAKFEGANTNAQLRTALDEAY